VSAEDLAKLLHDYHQALAHDLHGLMSQVATFSWEQASPNERKLIIASARLALLEPRATSDEEQPHRQYFAKAGEAEWGC
jgi:hypothetical protein